MSFRARGDRFQDYHLTDDPQLSGQSQWAFATKGEEKYFIKRFLSPVKPSKGDAGSAATLERKRRAAKIFEERHAKLNVLMKAEAPPQNLIVPVFSDWIGGKYTKIFPFVDALGTTAKDVAALPNNKKSLIMLQIAEAIAVLHAHQIVHSDIKWTNLLFTEKSVASDIAKKTVMPMVIDFDAGYHITDRPDDPDDLTFDAPYAAPEIWKFVKTASAPDGRELGFHTDIFSLGVLFHEMACGHKPMGNETEPIGKHMLAYAPKMKLCSTSAFYPLVSGMLKFDPNHRPKIEQVISELTALLGVNIKGVPEASKLGVVSDPWPKFIEARPPPPPPGLKGMLVRAWRRVKKDWPDEPKAIKTSIPTSGPWGPKSNEPKIKTTMTDGAVSAKALSEAPEKLRVTLPKRPVAEKKSVLKHSATNPKVTSSRIKTTITKAEVRREAPTPLPEAVGVRIGTKLSIRYFNGPRAGVVAKFWFQKTTYDHRFEVAGYKSVGTDSPLGEALEGAQVGDIVTFNVRDEEIRVQIIDMKHA